MDQSLREYYDVVVVGGGQAGLSASVCLAKYGIDHVVLERNRIAESWRSQRWDNFCLVTPNWQCTLPDFAYDQEYQGADPDGFMKRDEIVKYLESFRSKHSMPVLEGTGVRNADHDGTRFRLILSNGAVVHCLSLVVATGGYHQPRIPQAGKYLPDAIHQIHSSQYKNADSLPDGPVLVVGTGQSGCQIAEDLHLEGRKVHLCVGSAPRSPRFYRGRDVTAWLVDMGAYAVTVNEHPMGKEVRKKTNHYLTGRDGGREIDLRRFASEGMKLHGRLNGVSEDSIQFGNDLKANLDGADASAERIKNEIDKHIEKHGIQAPEGERYVPCWQPDDVGQSEISIGEISTVIWCTGFSKDYRWLDVDAFDEDGEPEYERGVSRFDGLYFLGLPWMHTWGSGRFSGVASDARHVTGHLANWLESSAASCPPS